jgi:hypothetical protein
MGRVPLVTAPWRGDKRPVGRSVRRASTDAIMDHTTAASLLGVYALDACNHTEVAGVEAHLVVCAACAGEALRLRNLAGWIGTVDSVSPPAGLRDRVLSAARDDPEDNRTL